MKYYLQIESSKETGNWCYVIRKCKDNSKELATGSRNFSFKELNRLNKR